MIATTLDLHLFNTENMLRGFWDWAWLIKIPYLEKLKMFYTSSWHFSAIENEEKLFTYTVPFFPSKIQMQLTACRI